MRSESYGNRKIPCLTSDYARLEDKAIETNDCDKDVKLKILVKTRTVTNTKIDGKNWNNLHLIRFKEAVGIQGRRMRMKTRGFKVLFLSDACDIKLEHFANPTNFFTAFPKL